LRIPLMIRAPSIKPRRVSSVVRLIDVMPTVLDLLGLPHPATDGVSLTGLMKGERQELEAYAESIYPQRFGWSPLRSLRDGRFKLIEAPRPELYDLEQDPLEEHNLYGERPALAAAFRRRLETFATTQSWSAAEPVAAGAPLELRERLAALGYVSQGSLPAHPQRAALLDSKDFIARNCSSSKARE